MEGRSDRLINFLWILFRYGKPIMIIHFGDFIMRIYFHTSNVFL